jgi:hypothetical protein
VPDLRVAVQKIASALRFAARHGGPEQLSLGVKTVIRPVERAMLTLPRKGAWQLALGLETTTEFVAEPVFTLPEMAAAVPGRMAALRGRLQGLWGRFRRQASNASAEPPPPPPSPASNQPAQVNWRAIAGTAAGAALLGGGTVWYLNATRHGRDNRELYRTGPYFF